MRSGTIAFLLAVVACQHLPTALPPTVLAGLAGAALLFWALRGLRLVGWILAGFCWAGLHGHLGLENAFPAEQEHAVVEVTGVVAEVPQAGPRRTRFLFRVQTLATPNDGAAPHWQGLARLYWYDRKGKHPGADSRALLAPGQHWRLQVRMRNPRGSRNWAGYDYEGWLFAKGVAATGYVRQGRLLPASGSSPVDFVHGLRARLLEIIAGSGATHGQQAIISALSVGLRHHLTPRQWQVFKATGTAHLMAISGLHIGLVAGLVFVLARLLWQRIATLCVRLAAPVAAALAGLAVATGYSALAGFAIPAQRALVMVAAAMAVVVLRRRVNAANVFCLALLVVLVIDPLAVQSAGFWLSFGAAGLLLYSHAAMPVFCGHTPGMASLWRRIGQVHLVASVGLLPVLGAVFGFYPWLSFAANVLAVPWVSLIIVPLCLAAVVCAPLSTGLAGILFDLAGYLMVPLWEMLAWLAATPWQSYRFTDPGPLRVAAAVLGVVLLFAPRGLGVRPLGLIFMLPMMLSEPPRPAPGAVWLTLLDVGHGQAAVITTHRRAVVFDAGPGTATGWNAGARIVVPELHRQGLGQVDLLLLSHSDVDHSGGHTGILNHFRVIRVMESRADSQGGWRCRAGQRWEWDQVRFEILHPAPGQVWDDNNGSCVLKVSSSGGSILLTGDIEKAAETALLKLPPGALKADVLVVPHHGSRSSSSKPFVRRVSPEVALISSGSHPRRRPHREVLATYREAGVQVYDTARAGAIRVAIHPRNGLGPVRTWWAERRRYWHRPP